ncbi:hypothetical protein Ava_3700 [Trichormus variabilis ATCC 29413]|uniref:Uncharacterized protein n=1 Tax=Trichormus variabilis (strain ATCC 29413 / PCC 7937) TaxID=240292 RepID=Q3M6T1_TRIV2|nr:hypothetical protein Ava_3700 [Trichormus variabilis ATCC 29413]
MVITPNTASEVIYPESDGQPMADNTKQFRWIVTIKENLEILFATQPDVFIAGDLFWYPVAGNPNIKQAPDTLAAFGRRYKSRGDLEGCEGVREEFSFTLSPIPLHPYTPIPLIN